MKAKLFVQCFIASLLVGLALVASFNYIIDTYGVFHADFSKGHAEPAQHLLKMQYLLKNNARYTGFCFGSSRVGSIDLTKIRDGNNYYNMTYAGGLPWEWEKDIELLLKNHTDIHMLLLGIDDFSFRSDPRTHNNNLLMRYPYDDDNMVKTYLLYLFKDPFFRVPVNDQFGNGVIFDIYGTGRPLADYVDEQIERNPKEHARDPRFSKINVVHGNRIEHTIGELKKIFDMAATHNISCIVFINPIYHQAYLANNLDEFNEFKRALAKVTNYYDFSGLNRVTTNPYYFYESSHYRVIVGDMMIQRIFHESPDAETEFGVWVTKDNIESHIAKLEKEVEGVHEN